MSCFHPLKRFVIGEDIKHDRDIAFIRPAFIDEDGRLSEVTYLCKDFLDWVPWTLPYPPPLASYERAVQGTMIRCGKCMGCRIDKSKEWANRCLLELEYHKSAYFLTITYDDQFVPISYYSDPATGEAQPSLTLRKRDFQLFMKRLRKRHVKPLRFFAAGEYGDNTFRPHYHAIIFGLELGDLVPYGKTRRGDMLYTSDFLHSVWSRRDAPIQQGSVTSLSTPDEKARLCTPYGRITVSPVTWETCAYVARYTTKKLYSMDAKAYEEFNLEPPFLLMSRHPGIGAQYLVDHPEVKDFEFISVSTEKGGKKFRPPYYFEKKIEQEMEVDDYALRKVHRQEIMQAAVQAQLRQTNMTYGELLQVKEQKFLSRIKSLKRDGV